MNAHSYDSDRDYAEACGDDSHAIETRAEDLLGDIAALIEQAPGDSRTAFVAALDELLEHYGNLDGEAYKRRVSEALRQMAEALARQELTDIRAGY